MPRSARASLKHLLYGAAVGVSRLSGVPRLRRLADRPGTLRVLMYHKVTDGITGPLAVPVELFRRQQRHLREHYRVISLGDLVAHLDRGIELPARAVLLTFDDGYEDNVTNAYPILRALGHPATILVCTDLVGGGTLPHDRGLEPSPTATWEQLRDVMDVFEVASQGRTHEVLTELSPRAARDEIAGSKREIEARIGAPARAFTYPRGFFNADLEAAVVQAGYELCFVVSHGTNPPGFHRLRIRRLNVEPYGMWYFRALLDGATEVLGVKDTAPGRAFARRLAPLEWARRSPRRSADD